MLLELFFLHAVVDVADCFEVDVDGIDLSGVAGAAGGAHGEPPGAGSDVGDVFAGRNAEDVHDAIDLQFIFAAGGFEMERSPV